jgi:hypothetical protein
VNESLLLTARRGGEAIGLVELLEGLRRTRWVSLCVGGGGWVEGSEGPDSRGGTTYNQSGDHAYVPSRYITAGERLCMQHLLSQCVQDSGPHWCGWSAACLSVQCVVHTVALWIYTHHCRRVASVCAGMV